MLVEPAVLWSATCVYVNVYTLITIYLVLYILFWLFIDLFIPESCSFVRHLWHILIVVITLVCDVEEERRWFYSGACGWGSVCGEKTIAVILTVALLVLDNDIL